MNIWKKINKFINRLYKECEQVKKFKFRADITAVTVVVFIVCIVLVSVMLMQFRTVEQTDITAIETMRESELRTLLSEWKARYEEV